MPEAIDQHPILSIGGYHETGHDSPNFDGKECLKQKEFRPADVNYNEGCR
jgi:hypothetical protein